MEALERVGLKLNDQKCCRGPFFRESCGTDWYRGVLVTPLRFKALYPADRSPEGQLATVAYANACARLGYTRTSQLLARMAQTEHVLPKAACVDSSTDLLFERSEKDGLPLVLHETDGRRANDWNRRFFRSRFSASLQRNEFLVPVVSTTTVETRSCWSEYFRWHVNHGPEVRSCRYTVPHRIKIIKRWTNL